MVGGWLLSFVSFRYVMSASNRINTRPACHREIRVETRTTTTAVVGRVLFKYPLVIAVLRKLGLIIFCPLAGCRLPALTGWPVGGDS